jgi:isoaspartyl peptidase/L-asparaginase-like protein (Ntn-hydrolase superfamily)
VPRVHPVLLIHGGAGPRPRSDIDPAERLASLRTALNAGAAAIDEGALSACIAAVVALEDEPLFNAGFGAALARDGGAWCDAAVMTGDGRAGAVAGVSGIRHPVRAAAAVRSEGEMVLWAGHSDTLADRYRLERVAPDALVTERQRDRLRTHLAQGDEPGMGTVGAVCLDRQGRLAAATSTGGRTGKAPARVGDSPLIGAGTWADADTCAVSATGEGEAFIVASFAHEVHARMRHAGQGLDAAAREALDDVLAAGGRGGAICVGADGTFAMPATAEMFQRGWLAGGGPPECRLEA